jgi:BASS family bile acid:Na+ symporter
MLASLLGSRFWIPAYIALAIGLYAPGEFSWLKPAVPVALGSILLFTCLRIPLAEVAAGLRDRNMLARTGWMTALRLMVLPAIAWAATWLVAPAWAPGVALVTMMPAGLSSVALADLHRGDRVLALFLILLTSLLAPLTIPGGMVLVHPGTTPGAAQLAGQAVYILALLAIPFTAAQLVRRFAPGLVAQGMGWWGRCSICSLIAMILVSCLANRSAWADWSPARMLVPLLLVCFVSALALGTALLLRRWTPGPAVTSFACAAFYMNNGLAIAYATRFHPGEAQIILPCVIMQVPMLAAVVLWGRWAQVLEQGDPAADGVRGAFASADR